MICADTSFLFSLYGSDVNTHVAQNAVRLRFFQGKLTVTERDRILNGYRQDLRAGRLIAVSLNLHAVFNEAARLSAAHTETVGNRA